VVISEKLGKKIDEQVAGRVGGCGGSLDLDLITGDITSLKNYGDGKTGGIKYGHFACRSSAFVASLSSQAATLRRGRHLLLGSHF
jgi:hypothetical protein